MEEEKFPFTIPVAVSYFYAFFTLAFIDIQAIANGLVQLQQEVQFLLDLLIGGILILVLFGIAITGSARIFFPPRQKLLSRWDPKQGLAIILALTVTSVWQLYINQIQVTPYLAGLAPQTATAFKLDNAIAEESAFGSVGIVFYLFLRYRLKTGRLIGIITASAGSALATAIIFDYFHNTSLAYSNNPNALLFIFGLRMVLTPLTIYTHSLFSSIVAHGGWNFVT